MLMRESNGLQLISRDRLTSNQMAGIPEPANESQAGDDVFCCYSYTDTHSVQLPSVLESHEYKGSYRGCV